MLISNVFFDVIFVYILYLTEKLFNKNKNDFGIFEKLSEIRKFEVRMRATIKFQTLMRVTMENIQSLRGSEGGIFKNLSSPWPGGTLSLSFLEENR